MAFVTPGAHARTIPVPVPETSWTRDPETLSPGEYAYDTFSSADFRLGDGFPFGDLVYAVSGRSSYEMVQAIRGFYASMGRTEEGAAGVPDKDREAIVRSYRDDVAWRMHLLGFTHRQIGQAFGVTDRTSRAWIARMRGEGRPERAPEEGRRGIRPHRHARGCGRKESGGLPRRVYIYLRGASPRGRGGAKGSSFPKLLGIPSPAVFLYRRLKGPYSRHSEEP